MTYNVFGGTLNPTQSILNQCVSVADWTDVCRGVNVQMMGGYQAVPVDIWASQQAAQSAQQQCQRPQFSAGYTMSNQLWQWTFLQLSNMQLDDDVFTKQVWLLCVTELPADFHNYNKW